MTDKQSCTDIGVKYKLVTNLNFNYIMKIYYVIRAEQLSDS